ncbi:uncharacterized protein LOC114539600 [Dendronephthya gigantea]|nr:uncharacterized protein LOC114539600 [Dendronephthya gigantea]
MNASVSVNTNDGDFEAYGNEPLADEAWLQNYARETEQERRQIEEYTQRLQSEVPVNSWCNCGNCNVDLLTNPKECKCCHEIADCLIEMQDEVVVSQLGKQPNCITDHPGFNAVCLNRWSLQLSASQYQTRDGIRYRKKALEGRFFRVVAYRQFTRMVHGILHDKRIPLPACAYHAIRSTFPVAKNEHFEGYQEGDL